MTRLWQLGLLSAFLVCAVGSCTSGLFVTPTPTPTHTPTVTPIPTFGDIVTQLDMPLKLVNHLKREFRVERHEGYISWRPEEFFDRRSGDCKDYTTFASHMLTQHGYRAELVSFAYYDQGVVRSGHVVDLYQKGDGPLHYISNYNLMGEVSSVNDLLEKDKRRVDASRMGGHIVLPAGSTVGCSPD